MKAGSPILLDELIAFVRGARHLVYKKKKVVMSEEHYALLMELEQKLMKQKV
jgi:hypothetical protein